jgi:hypothetical protein
MSFPHTRVTEERHPSPRHALLWPTLTLKACNMDNPDHIDWLRQFREDLRSGDTESLSQHVEHAGLDLVLNPAFVSLAQEQDARAVVVLLATLGQANAEEPAPYGRLLAAYLFLQGQLDLDSAASRCASLNNSPAGFYAALLACTRSPGTLPEIQTHAVTTDDLHFGLQWLINTGHSDAIVPVLKRWQSIDNSDKPWLLACRALVARVKHTHNRSQAAALGATVQQMIERAPPTQTDVLQALRVQSAELMLKARQGEAACTAAQKAFDHDNSVERRFALAKAHVLAGHLTLATEHMQRLLDYTLSDYAPPEQDIQHTPGPSFQVSAAEDTLRTINALLKAKGLQPFLMSGTLLGYHREGALLAHDKDVDLGLVGWEHQFTIAQALLEAGHFEFDLNQLNGKDRFLVSAHDLRNGMAVDFFLFHDHGDHFLHGIDFDMGFTQNFRFSKFGLNEAPFLGDLFFVPDNIERNLSENYGDWRKPASSYVVTVESPALMPEPVQPRLVLLYLELLKTLTKKLNPQRVRRILDHLKRSGWNALPAPTLARLEDWYTQQLAHNESPSERPCQAA